MEDDGLGSVLEPILPRLDKLFSGNVDAASPWLVLLICFIAIITVLWAGYWSRQARRWVSEAKSLLEGVGREDLWTRRAEIEQKAKNCSTPVADAWRDYDATLVVDDRRLLSTSPAEEFFNEHRFAPRLVDNRFLHAVPTSLTTLGLLGTFLGLTVGLRAVDLGSTTDELRDGIQTLVAGAALGFTASLWGVAMSLVTNVFERWQERRVVRSVRALQARVDGLFTMHSPEQSLSEIAFSTNESNEALQVLHEKIGSTLQESVGQFGQNLTTAVGQIGANTDRAVAQVGETMGMAVAQIGLNTDHAVAQVGEETSRAVSEAIHNSLAPIMSELVSTAARQSADVFNAISDRLTSSFEELGVSLAEKLQSSSESMRDAIDTWGSSSPVTPTSIVFGCKAWRMLPRRLSRSCTRQPPSR